MQQDEEGLFKGHYPCPSCSSGNALAVYQKENDKGEEYLDGYCFSCQTYCPPSKTAEHIGSHVHIGVERSQEQKEEDLANVAEIMELEHRGVRERRLKKQYCEMYGMRVSYHPETGDIDTHYYPLTKEGEVTGFKVRELPKTFRAVGDTKKTQLFGESLFSESGEYANKVSKRFCFVTEGELDCIALQQMLSEEGDGRFMNAVVSLPNGANAKAVRQSYKFLNSFETVVLVMDQDAPGKAAALEIAKALPMGKCKIASYSEKDPCEMLKKGKSAEMSKLMWTATPYTPGGVVSGEGMWETVMSEKSDSSVPYPWEGLTKMLKGIRTPELVTLVAGSGVAKSTFARAIMHHLVKTTNENVAGMFLEESLERTGKSLMSFEAKKLVHLPDHGATKEEMKAAFDATLGTGRVFFFDSFGSNDIDTICENVTYFAKAAQCKYIFLDHISILVSGGGHGDERKALDEISTKLRTLVQELDICLYMVCHLKRPSDGLGHEQGAQTALSQLRGSAGIGQLSDTVIGIERNGQAEDPVERNTSTLRVLKNRFVGTTGVATRVHYNPVTGELTEVSEEETEEYAAKGLVSEFEDAQEAPWEY